MDTVFVTPLGSFSRQHNTISIELDNLKSSTSEDQWILPCPLPNRSPKYPHSLGNTLHSTLLEAPLVSCTVLPSSILHLSKGGPPCCSLISTKAADAVQCLYFHFKRCRSGPQFLVVNFFVYLPYWTKPGRKKRKSLTSASPLPLSVSIIIGFQ